MAAKKSAQYPHQWPDGKWHSISYDQHLKNEAQKAGKVTAPTGTYDPNLDAELGRSSRGLADLLRDIGTGVDGQPLGTERIRQQTDLSTQLGLIDQGKRRAGEDYSTSKTGIETGYQRSLDDLLKARAQGEQDYGTNIASLQRGYQRLGTAQGEGQRKAGAFVGSGAALQAARKRAANEAIDRQPIDTAYKRFMEENQTTQGRLAQNKDTALSDLLRGYTRAGEDFTTQTGQLQLGVTRQGEDWAETLRRAQREQTAFEGDIDQAKIAQALQNNPGAKLPIIPAAIPKSQQLMRGITINGKPVTYGQWEQGDILKALLAGAQNPKKKVV